MCEHWNNSIDKQYTRNLGTGNGIELIFINKTLTAVAQVAAGVPASFALSQNYPNPFNPSTAICYRLSTAGFTTLRIFDIRGREVSTLVNKIEGAGDHTVVWNAQSVPSGAYFYRLTSGTYGETKKLVVQK